MLMHMIYGKCVSHSCCSYEEEIPVGHDDGRSLELGIVADATS